MNQEARYTILPNMKNIFRALGQIYGRRQNVFSKETGAAEMESVLVIALVGIPLIVAVIFFAPNVIGTYSEPVAEIAADKLTGDADRSAPSTEVTNPTSQLPLEFLPEALFFLVGGSLTAGFAWGIKAQVRYMRQETRILILEELSLGKPITRDELGKNIREKHFYSRLFSGLYSDALETLLAERLVVLRNGSYQLSASAYGAEITP